MPRVDVTLNGRTYRVACDEGQEERLKRIAAYVDGRLQSLAASAGGASDVQLLVLTCLLLADELHDLKDELAATRALAIQAPAPRDDEEVVAAMDHLARRIEDIAARLERA